MRVLARETTDRPFRFFSLRLRPGGLVIAAGVVACAATLFGFLGRYWWFFDLFSHFRVQYVIGLLVLSVLLLFGRYRRTATAFLLFACMNLTQILPLYFGGSTCGAAESPSLRAMLINVNTVSGDPARVRDVVSAASPDILVLEEISSGWMSHLAWLTNSHPYSCTEPREDNFGIGVFSKHPLSETEITYIGKAGVPSVVVTVRIGNADLRIVATHPLPPGNRDYSRWRNDQLDQLPDHVRSTLPVLLLGDLNVTPWNYHFRQLLARTGLQDSAKGYGVQPTWPSFSPFLRIPIDHCLHSPEIAILDRRIGDNVSSDHYPLIVDFVIDNTLRAKGPAEE